MEEIKNENEAIIEQPQAKQNQRNSTLGFFELFAAIMIVFIHAAFPGVFGEVIVKGMARFGVPLFFTISGFYLIKPNMTKEELRLKLKQRIIKTLILILFSFCIYFLLGIFVSLFGSNSTGIVDYLKTTFSIKNILKLLILNYPLTNVPSWFLIAMLYSYVIIYIFANKFLKYKWIAYTLALMPLFWIIFRMSVGVANIEIAGYSLSSSVWYFSWYANGLLFISLGIVLKRFEDKIKKLNFNMILIAYFTSFVLMTLETYFSHKLFGLSISYYLFNIVNVICIICIAVLKPDLFSKSKIVNPKGNYTMFIYIFHPAIISVLNFIIKKIGMSENILVSWIAPIIVLILAVASAMIFNKILCIIKDRRKLKNSESFH